MRRGLIDVEISAHDEAAYQQLGSGRQQALLAPEDDMWATFADMAVPHSLRLGSQLLGRFSLDEHGQLHGFYVSREFTPIGAGLLAHVVDAMNVRSLIVSSVDPEFMELGLDIGGSAFPVAWMYEHDAPPDNDDVVEVRLASTADHSATVTFNQTATGASKEFLVPYLAERIGHGELHLVEVDGQIAATGECRVDHRAPGNAHLGLIVDSGRRGRGIGGRLMRTLVQICRGHGLIPRCSTEPSNEAAQKVIGRAGFRARHHILRIAMSETSSPTPVEAVPSE